MPIRPVAGLRRRTILQGSPDRILSAGGFCRLLVGFVIGWLKHAFSILRIFTDFRMPRLPMRLLERARIRGS